MAIRNKKLLDNAFKRIDSKTDDKLVAMRGELMALADQLYALSKDLKDVIDTYIYCREKGYGKYISNLTKDRTKLVGIKTVWHTDKQYHNAYDGVSVICTDEIHRNCDKTPCIVFVGADFFFCKDMSSGFIEDIFHEVKDAINSVTIVNKNSTSEKVGAYLNYYSLTELVKGTQDGKYGRYISMVDLKDILVQAITWFKTFKEDAFNLFDNLG